MTWNVLVAAENVPLQESACMSCKHGQFPPSGPQPCNISRVAHSIGYVLNTIDAGADGHIAYGTAILMCNGYEKKAEPAPEPDKAADQPAQA